MENLFVTMIVAISLFMAFYSVGAGKPIFERLFLPVALAIMVFASFYIASDDNGNQNKFQMSKEKGLMKIK